METRHGQRAWCLRLWMSRKRRLGRDRAFGSVRWGRGPEALTWSDLLVAGPRNGPVRYAPELDLSGAGRGAGGGIARRRRSGRSGGRSGRGRDPRRGRWGLGPRGGAGAVRGGSWWRRPRRPGRPRRSRRRRGRAGGRRRARRSGAGGVASTGSRGGRRGAIRLVANIIEGRGPDRDFGRFIFVNLGRGRRDGP